MGVENIHRREAEIIEMIWDGLEPIPNLHILAPTHKKRLGVISFYIDNLHYNVGVKMLNDRFGIQTRGGCSCAGTYGHFLLNVTPELSHSITGEINSGNCSSKPGWIRMSIHPTHTNEEIRFLIASIKEMAANFPDWMEDYEIDYFNGNINCIDPSAMDEMESRINDCFVNLTETEVVGV